MALASNRQDLLGVTKNAFARLTRALDTVSENRAEAPHATSETILGLVVRLAYWLEVLLGCIDASAAGASATRVGGQVPVRPVTWDPVHGYDAGPQQTAERVGWIEARERLAAAHVRLMVWMQASSDNLLFVGGHYAWMGPGTLARWAEPVAARHYRAVTEVIRSRARLGGDTGAD